MKEGNVKNAKLKHNNPIIRPRYFIVFSKLKKQCNEQIIYKPNLHVDVDIIYEELNQFKGIDTTDLEDLSMKKNVFNISSKLHRWLPNQYGKISLNIKDYIKNKYKQANDR